jgi:hypothetical protein
MTSILDSSELYNRFMIGIQVRERLDGGVPKDPELIKAWVVSKTGFDDEQTQKQIDAHKADLDAATEEQAEAMWCGFKKDDRGPYIETRQIKAMLRECAVVLGITKAKRGSRQIVQHGFEVRGHGGDSKVYIDAKNVGTVEGAIHVMTPQGPRNALKRVDFVGPESTLEFEVWILKTAPQETRHLGEEDLKKLFQLAQEDGLGANRSQGSGKFDVVVFKTL